MWQKAKVIRSRHAWLVGREIWTRGRPLSVAGRNAITGERLPTQDILFCNLLSQHGDETGAYLSYLELLGGPDAFCEEPPMISFAEWSTPPLEVQ